MPVNTKRLVVWQETDIHYCLERKAVKNINLRVKADGIVYVSAPQRTPVAAVDRFVAGQGAFIIRAQQRFRQKAAAAVSAVERGTVYILGQQLRLETCCSDEAAVHERTGVLQLCLPRPDDLAARQQLLDNYIRRRCQTLFTVLVKAAQSRLAPYGVPYPHIRLKNMRTRWGSCSPHKQAISLNIQLLAAPRDCIEYVVVHELCHFLQPNHAHAFYGLVAQFLPDWQARRRKLRDVSL